MARAGSDKTTLHAQAAVPAVVKPPRPSGDGPAPEAEAPAPRRRRGVLGWWSAMAFNVGLLGLPLALMVLASAMEGVRLARYEATAPALAAAKAQIEARAAALIPRSTPRADALSYLVGREAAEGDAEAARGFLMAAGVLLSGQDATRMYQRLKADASDEDLSTAAVRFLEPGVAEAYLSIQGGRARSGGGAFFLVGDERELAQAARRWIDSGDGDVTGVVLSGLTVVDFGLSPADAAAVRVGASVLKSARAAGRLSSGLLQNLSEAVAAAFPADRLRARLTAALASPGALADEGAATAAALRDSVVANRFLALVGDLRALRGMAAETSPAGALQLVAHARTPADFERLHLLAIAGRERAVAVAKRTPVGGGFLDAAPITWRIPQDVLQAAIFLLISVGLMMIATVAVLKHGIERASESPTGRVTVVTPRLPRTKALAKPERSKIEPAL